ncbi:MAG: metallophosphoesterase [Thermomicrobiales bacterium]
MRPIFVIGDVHGQIEKLRALLRGAGLTGPDDAWSGGDSHLWFVGDLTDRGEDGIGAIDLIRRLQREAPEAGGAVDSLLGNHDMLIVAVAHFAGLDPTAAAIFLADWEANGGVTSDLARLTEDRISWLMARPAMARDDNALLVHADTTYYLQWGDSVAAVNRTVSDVLHRGDARRWARLFSQLCDRGAFSGPDEDASVDAFLDQFGGEMVIYGHTPISKITGQPPEQVREPLISAHGRAVNVDGGMYRGGPGFVYRVPGE